MKQRIGKFFTKISRALFTVRIEREIYHKVFPHICQEADHGYPFGSKAEFEKQCLFSELDAKLHVELIEKRAAQMPKAYGEAFRYLAYRDINERMKMYLELAERRVNPQTCDPHFVAVHA
jgi:hypothetical protein